MQFKPVVPVFQATVVTVLSWAIIVCNLVLIMAVTRTPCLHTKTNALLLSVAFSEVIMGIFVMPFIAAVLFKPSLRFSSKLCEFIAFMTSLSMSSKSLSMLSVSIDRCIAISHPLQYSCCITKTTTTALACSVWLISILFALFPLINIGRHSFVLVHGRCMIDLYFTPVFAVVKEVTCTVVPSIAVFVMLVIVIAEARSHHRVTLIAQLAVAMYSGPSTIRGINYARTTFKALRTYLVITCVYLLTCFPRSVYVIIDATEKHQSSSTFNFFAFLTYFCSISTPLLISTLNIKFRESIRSIFVWKNKVHPTTDQEPYTISTGLHTILEHSMGFAYVPLSKEHRQPKLEAIKEPLAGPSRLLPVVRFAPSVLHEAHSSSSGEIIISKPLHAVLRKSLSSPS